MLDTLLNAVATSLTAALSIPTAVYAAECAAALLPRKARRGKPPKRPPVAIVIPAHNEESEITQTLSSIRPQLRGGDRLIVVADNCDDRTAMLARKAGAEVIEREDRLHRGKGHALHAGVSRLADAPPPVVILIDADCRVGPNTIDTLARKALSTGRPVQSRYLLTAPPGASLGQAVAEFAFLVKNRVRPVGLNALGLPCQLTGSGMAFPWAVLSQARLANSHLVEDMKLGLELASMGHAPQFCDDALITSQFPVSNKGTRSQRQRWEAGHLGMSRFAIGALMQKAAYRHPAYLAMLLDVIVPPLTLLGLMLTLMLLVTAALALAGLSLLPLGIAAANLLLLLGGTLSAWFAFGRKALPARFLFAIPLYALRKAGLYPRLMLGRARDGWVRTDRTKNSGI